MHALHLVEVVAGAAVTSAIVTWYFARDRRVLRAIAAAPVVRIGEVKDGTTVRVSGKVRLGPGVLEAPFSGRPCAHYDALLEERTLDAGNEIWSTIAHEAASRPFFLEDSSGSARIDTTRFEGVVERRRHKPVSGHERERALAFLAKHGQAAEIPADRVLRYREGVLEAGDRVTVLGAARLETHEGQRILVVGASEGAAVRATDEPTMTMTIPPPGPK